MESQERDIMLTSKVVISTAAEKETFLLGKMLGNLVKTPAVFALYGELGTGKTVLVRGAARGLGVTGRVRSPTFTLLQVYRGRLPLYHFDFFRLETEEELFHLGAEEYLEADGAVFMEWASKFPHFLPPQRLDIYLERPSNRLEREETGPEDLENQLREVSFIPHGGYYQEFLEKLLEINRFDFRGRLKSGLFRQARTDV